AALSSCVPHVPGPVTGPVADFPPVRPPLRLSSPQIVASLVESSARSDDTPLGVSAASVARWHPAELALLAMLGVLLGALLPLMDPDFPMHLAVGEWIVRERAVPFVEPFAWTRAGEPYHAYSWLPQVTFY